MEPWGTLDTIGTLWENFVRIIPAVIYYIKLITGKLM